MFVHGDNLKQKESHKEKYTDQEARNYLPGDTYLSL